MVFYENYDILKTGVTLSQKVRGKNSKKHVKCGRNFLTDPNDGLKNAVQFMG
jgi:hypothetical protein